MTWARLDQIRRNMESGDPGSSTDLVSPAGGGSACPLVDVLTDEEIRDGADFDDGADIDIIMMGPPMDGSFARLPDLKLVISPCAGIDELIDDPYLASDTAVYPAQDPAGDKMLDDYALLLTLFHHRNMQDFLAANVTTA